MSIMPRARCFHLLLGACVCVRPRYLIGRVASEEEVRASEDRQVRHLLEAAALKAKAQAGREAAEREAQRVAEAAKASEAQVEQVEQVAEPSAPAKAGTVTVTAFA